MIKYHCTPITPRAKFDEIMPGRNALVSWFKHDDVNKCFEVCDKVLLDNGAYSFWNRDKIFHDWDKFYRWVERYPQRRGFFIPDNILSSEKENDELIKECPYDDGIPVFHCGESMERLKRLVDHYEYIAISTTYDGRKIDRKFFEYMEKIMIVVCDHRGIPRAKIHALGIMNVKIIRIYPFYSGDSTILAKHRQPERWKKALKRLEKVQSPEVFRVGIEWKEMVMKSKLCF